MSEWQKWDMSRYQLRHAAGIYWLIDMKQPGYPYKKPLPLNEMAARIWRMMGAGLSLEEISAILGEEYEVSSDEIGEDVRAFSTQLKQCGFGCSTDS